MENMLNTKIEAERTQNRDLNAHFIQLLLLPKCSCNCSVTSRDAIILTLGRFTSAGSHENREQVESASESTF